MIRKERKRYSKVSDAEQASHTIWHLIPEDFPGLSFEKGKEGLLILDQNTDGVDLTFYNTHIYCSEFDDVFTTTSDEWEKCVAFQIRKRNWHKYFKAEIELYSTEGLTAHARLSAVPVEGGLGTSLLIGVSTSSFDTWEKKSLSLSLGFNEGELLKLSLEYRMTTGDVNAKIRRIELFLSAK